MTKLKRSALPYARHECCYKLRKPTAFGKKSIFNIDCQTLQPDSWRRKPFTDWTPLEVAHWISSVADDDGFSVYDVELSQFRVSGAQLAALTEQQFAERDSRHGRALFGRFRAVVQSETSPAVQEPKKRRGRPVTNRLGRRVPKKRFRLWEFLLYLLSKPEHCPSVLEWEKREDGSFRIMQSARLAELWGHFRGRKNMDYVKLSRLMRYYYKQEVLIGDKQRLVYRFGPNAEGWKEISQEQAWPDDILPMSPTPT